MEKSKFYQIKNITEHEYVLVGCDGSVITRPIQDIDKSASAFTIEDAKDGDVLVTGKENIFIFKSISGYAVYDYCGLYFGKFMDDSANVNSPTSAPIGYHPATKEQRELLFSKMKEAGYEWDANHKQLKKIEQKPAWSEEDEEILDEIIDFLENGTVKLQHDLSLYASWLKSLKDRYAWRASWEQLDALEYHLKHTNENSRLYKETKKLYDQLKKL